VSRFAPDWAAIFARRIHSPLRTVFLGTPVLAVPSLAALAAHPAIALAGVVTQPARRAGRGRKLRPSPVSAWAASRDLPVWAPDRLRDLREELTRLAPDLLVVVAYGKLLPGWLLALPSVAPLNVHASLLPRHRGAAPIEAAILAGDQQTGVTLMGMESDLDAGPILLTRTVKLTTRTTGTDLAATLADLGSEVLSAGVDELLAGRLRPQIQDAQAATYAPKVTADDRWLDWVEPAVRIDRKVRAFAERPGARARRGKDVLKILGGVPEAIDAGECAPGTVVAVGRQGITTATGSGGYRITKLQPPGKQPMPADAYARGYRVVRGEQWTGGPAR